MNKIEKQILKNQRTIMSVLRRYSSDKGNEGHVSSICKRQMETLKILEPIKQPSIKEKTNDAFCERGEE